ncbi:hypothetical protein B0H14DRAFT_2225919, partial [Mycena olivaceomarginata]
LEQFLAHYPLFQYDPSAPVSAQFQAMQLGAGSGLGLGVDTTRAGFRLTVVQIFNDLFGIDMNDLKNWQSFCAVLEVSSVLTELQACRAAVQDVHVNLVDLLHWGIARAEIHTFETLDKLSAY